MRSPLENPWDRFADDYAASVEIAEGAFHLGPNGTALDLSRTPIALQAHEHALDLGCGSGANTRAVARLCASVTGVDGSVAQIRRAEAAGTPQNVSYHAAAIDSFLTNAAPASADFVYSVFALEYVADLRRVFSECTRVLTRGGRFLYCDLHPMVSAADIVGASMPKFVRSVDYFAEGPREFSWTVRNADTTPFVRYHHTLETLFTFGLDAGMRVAAVREPAILSPPGAAPYLDATVAAQHDVWGRLPYTLCIIFVRP